MRGGNTHDARRHPQVDLSRQHRFAATLANLDLRAFLDAELIEQRAMQPGLGWLGIGRGLQLRRAPNERIGEVDRDVGDALDTTCRFRRRRDLGARRVRKTRGQRCGISERGVAHLL